MSKTAGPTVLLFGTFDLLHPGHLHLFRQARRLALGCRLVVSVARDENVLKIKGRLPRHNQKQRLATVKSCPLVDHVVLGAARDYLGHIRRLGPDIIALGYDQKAYVAGLRHRLRDIGIRPKIVRLRAYRPKSYKTSLIMKKGRVVDTSGRPEP